MNSTLKNLINVLKRYRLANLLNILGLSLAFTAFTIIMIQVNYERSFDRIHSTSDRVFRAETGETGDFSFILPRPFVEAVITSSPHIKAGTIFNPFLTDLYITVTENNEKKGFREKFVTCSPGMTTVFDFTIIDGDKNCLENPENVIIPQSMAHRLFGNSPAVGQPIHVEEFFWSKNRNDLVVGAVYLDFPQNTQLTNVIYTAMDEKFALENWQASNYLCYLLLDSPDAVQDVADNFNKNFDFSKVSWWSDDKKYISLTALPDIYFLNESQDGNIARSGNRDTVNLISVIALLIIIIGAINFMNFSIAMAPARIRNINTQKVLGCPNGTLRFSLLSEAVGISFISFIISLGFIWLLHKTSALSFIDADLSLPKNMPVITLCGIVSVITGLIAGIYPAFYMTSIPPALALKGNYNSSPAGKQVRTVLVGFQFIVSVGLIIATSFIWLQNNYMQNYSLGFDKEQIAVVALNGEMFKNHRESYTNQLKNYAGIEDVAFSTQKLGARDVYSTSGARIKDEEFSYHLLSVSWNFMKVMGIPIIDGKEPFPSDETANKASSYFNKSARDKYGMQTGFTLYSNDTWSDIIVGFIDDVKFSSLRRNDIVALQINGTGGTMPVSYIKIKAGTDFTGVIKHIQHTIQQIDPAYPVQIEFYDDLFNQLYRKEKKLQKTITLFSLLTIIISIVGVLGLVIFETESRRKEIGIRKVHGASIGEILLMFNKKYAYIISICFLIATPVTYYLISRWLEGFVSKTPVYWWVFLAGITLITAITAFTVSIQSFKVATANPVDSIKSE